MTQEQVAAELGVSRQAVDLWEAGDISNATDSNANIPPPDFRVKLPADKKLLLVEKAQAGENQREIADEFKISQQRVSQIVTAYEKQQAKAKPLAEHGSPVFRVSRRRVL
jgi:predicted XRE-type DNA-binding protein